MIIEGNTENFEELVKEGIVVVDFYATWCGPCKMFAPVIQEVAKEIHQKVVMIDIDDSPDLAAKYAVMSVPTTMIFKNGEVVKIEHGYQDNEALTKWIKEV